MKIKKSILNLGQFSVAKSIFETIFPEENLPKNINQSIENHSIDVDFDVLIPSTESGESDQDKEVYIVSVRIKINEEKLMGYYIFVESASFFSFPKNNQIKEEEKQALISSGVNISITSLRNYISNITTFSFFGQYILPTIDMVDLLKQKQEQKA